MKLNVLKSETDYNKACKRLYDMDFKEGKNTASEIQEMELLTALIEHYQNHNAKFDLPEPIEAIKFRMEQGTINDKQLTKLLGGRSRKSEILSGKRKLSLNMIRTLHKELKIPAESLINSY